VAVRAAYRSQVRVTPDKGIDGGDGGEDETTSTVDSPAMATKRSPFAVNRKRVTGAVIVMLQSGVPTSSKTCIALSPADIATRSPEEETTTAEDSRIEPNIEDVYRLIPRRHRNPIPGRGDDNGRGLPD